MPYPKTLTREETIQFFWARVVKTDTCWIWTGARTTNGKDAESCYGKFGHKNVLAHKFSYELHNGTPAKNLVCHTCDNGLCVNPEHLVDATHEWNMRDMAIKGRSRNRFAQLTNQQIVEIRSRTESGEPLKGLASEFNITWNRLREIVKRRTRNHI